MPSKSQNLHLDLQSDIFGRSENDDLVHFELGIDLESDNQGGLVSSSGSLDPKGEEGIESSPSQG
jgi:hypothetical protein